MEDQTAEINELFAAPNTKLQGDVLGELKSTLRIHSISPQEMFFKWEAYSLKMGPDTQMNYKTAREFKKDLQDALERESRGKAHMQSANKRTTNGTPRNVNTGDVFGVYVLSGSVVEDLLLIMSQSGWTSLRHAVSRTTHEAKKRLWHSLSKSIKAQQHGFSSRRQDSDSRCCS
jgi:hypothetical protein